MDKEKLNSLIELLNQTEKKDRNTIIDKTSKENGLKFKEVMKLLIEAGYDPKGIPQEDPPNKPEEKKLSVILRHKTEYPGYRRAGLVLTQKAQTYEVTEEQLAILKKDSLVVIGEEKKDSANK
jgi:hypothetical protein